MSEKPAENQSNAQAQKKAEPKGKIEIAVGVGRDERAEGPHNYCLYVYSIQDGRVLSRRKVQGPDMLAICMSQVEPHIATAVMRPDQLGIGAGK